MCLLVPDEHYFELAHLEILCNTITLNVCTDMKNDAMLLNSVHTTRTTATHGEFQYDYVVNIRWWDTYVSLLVSWLSTFVTFTTLDSYQNC